MVTTKHTAMRQNRDVPRLTTPPGMPEDIAAVVTLISNPVRTEILHHLSSRPMTAMELSEAINLVHSITHRHLGVLEQHGLEDAGLPPGQRRGVPALYWHISTTRVRETADTRARYATGD